MEIFQVVGFGIVGTIFIVLIRENRPELARLLAVAVGLIILVYVIGYLRIVLDVINEMALEAGIEPVFLRTLFRIIGIAYLSEFGAQVARDAGEGSVAMKIELAGKIIILVMAIPILTNVLESILEFIP